MQNIIKETLKPGEAIRAASAKYLLMRDASNSVSLRVDTSEPVEVKRNDVVSLMAGSIIELSNHHASAVTIEYQMTNLAINTQSDAMAVTGAVQVNEIHRPVAVSSIQNGVAVTNFPAEQRVHVVSQPDINIPDIHLPDIKIPEISLPELSVDMPEEINVREARSRLDALGAVSAGERIPANDTRKAVIVFAPETNVDVVVIAGFIPLKPGGNATIPATNALSVEGHDGDVLHIGEIC